MHEEEPLRRGEARAGGAPSGKELPRAPREPAGAARSDRSAASAASVTSSSSRPRWGRPEELRVGREADVVVPLTSAAPAEEPLGDRRGHQTAWESDSGLDRSEAVSGRYTRSAGASARESPRRTGPGSRRSYTWFAMPKSTPAATGSAPGRGRPCARSPRRIDDLEPHDRTADRSSSARVDPVRRPGRPRAADSRCSAHIAHTSGPSAPRGADRL
jgi:hypothetical protein